MRPLMLVAAIFVAALLAWFVNKQVMASKNLQAELLKANSRTPETQIVDNGGTSKNVFVATADLPAGTILKASDFTPKPWPAEAIIANYKGPENTPNVKDLEGVVVRKDIAAGEPLTASSLVKAGEQGFLAVVLRAGTKAVSVAVTDTSGVSGLIYPGDYVDVILTQSLTPTQTISNGASTGGTTTTEQTTETIIRNARVIARGGNIIKAGTPVVAEGGNAPAPAPLAANANSLTLEVTPAIAEMLILAPKMGDVSVVLSSLLSENGALSAEMKEKMNTYPYLIESSLDASFAYSKLSPNAISPARAKAQEPNANKVYVFKGKKADGAATSPAPAK